MTNPLTPQIELTQVTDGPNPGWYMNHLGKSKGPGQYLPIKVDPGYTADFTFTIKKGADFSADPIAIQKGNAKPSGNGVDNQITVTSKTATVLKFNDSNKDHGPLNYVLTFKDGSQLDPIIDNGGCCGFESGFSRQIQLSGTSFALYLVIAFIAGMIAMMGVRAMRKGR